MKTNLSIRIAAIWLGSILLPLGGIAVHPHASIPTLSALPAEQPQDLLDAEQNAARLVDAIIQIESNGNPRKVGRHGERGLMQIKSGTWRDMTIRIFGKPLPFDQAFDPALNRRVGTAYLAFLQERILPRQKEWRADERALLLAAYNAGPGRLSKSRFDLARMPAQTQDYVERASALHDVYLEQMASAFRQQLLASRAAPSTGI